MKAADEGGEGGEEEMQGGPERDGDKRWETEQEKSRGEESETAVYAWQSQRVHTSSQARRLIGLPRVMWAEGEGGAWRRTGGWGVEVRRRGMCAGMRVYGVQRMQRQSWGEKKKSAGRLLTSRSETDKVRREERRLTLTARLLHRQNGCSAPTRAGNRLAAPFSITLPRKESVRWPRRPN